MGLEFRTNWLGLLLVVIVIAMGIEILYLTSQNRQLRKVVGSHAQFYQPLKQEDRVPPFTAQDLNGGLISVRYSPAEPHTMLLWFSASCPSCEENLQFWNDIYHGYPSDRLRVLGMCADSRAEAQSLASSLGLDFPIMPVDAPSLVEAYKGHALPQTLLISPAGTIEGVWPGPLGEEQKKNIVAALSKAGISAISTEEGGDLE